ncbi:DUF3108 domain-containing protein [Aromatoleum diolicum]|uniref:DUF3108 domain-containing protein n=1 Tax=Aromatoleum diolicum TaxID=75796 RepID=A0ABX1QAN4_9RHOO|nr:DUF3108 domain-containing protein [Aromatoleum diolicum]NMG75429.1 DUF3108 domain-containing protein [Aromatoleum diolicum]
MTASIPASSPFVSRRLLLAIGLSLLLHALLFIGPRLDLSPLPDLKPLDVKLVHSAPKLEPLQVPAAPPPAPARKKPPRPKEPPRTAQAELGEQKLEPAEVPVVAEQPEEPPPLAEPLEQSEPVPPNENVASAEAPESSEPAATEDAIPPGDTPAPPNAAPSAGTAWPRAGRISYMALMGEKHIPMGKSTHQWEVTADGQYRISELMEPTSVSEIPWYRPGRTLRESSGHITATGLRPERFVQREEGRPGELRAELDWSAQEIRSGAGSSALPETAQDALSLLYQLGYPGVAAGGDLPVTVGGALQTYRIEQLGEETVRLPFGERWRTQHVRARYGAAREMTDVWLATEHFGLPVLIRRVDDKGVIYYLVATEVLVSHEPSGAPPPTVR